MTNTKHKFVIDVHSPDGGTTALGTNINSDCLCQFNSG